MDSDVEVTIESSSKALKTTNTCFALGKVVCCLAVRNRLLHEWYSDRSIPYVAQLNARIPGHAVMLDPDCQRVEGNLNRRAGALHCALTRSKGRARESLLQKKFTIALTADDMQDCMSLAEENRTLVSIKEEMAERTAEIEDLKTRMAKEISEYKLLVRQQEEQLTKEGFTNTGKTFDQVHIYCVAKHRKETLLFTFVV